MTTQHLSYLKRSHRGGNQHQVIPAVLLLGLVAGAIACDKSLLPKGTTIINRGPVLQILCKPDQAPWEVPHDTMVPARSKRQFGRYLCLYGNTWWRINPNGRENSTFFCAEKRTSRCDPLDYNPADGELIQHHGVAQWKPISGGEGDILYCTNGKWYRLRGGPLPNAVVAGYQESPVSTSKALPSATVELSPAKPTSARPDVAETFSTLRQTPDPHLRTEDVLVPQSTPRPIKEVPKGTPPSRGSTHTAKTLIGLSPSLRALARYYLSSPNIVVLEGRISGAVHDQLHHYTRIAFYCLLVIGGSALAFGVVVLLRVRRQVVKLTLKTERAHENLASLV